jgi:hypothetical protein
VTTNENGDRRRFVPDGRRTTIGGNVVGNHHLITAAPRVPMLLGDAKVFSRVQEVQGALPVLAGCR